MKPITEYIQKKHIDKVVNPDDTLYMEGFNNFLALCDYFANSETNSKSYAIREIKKFLKGKEHKTGITLRFEEKNSTKYYTYYHIHRYADMHMIDISIVPSDDIAWPNADAWKDKVKLDPLNDRDNVESLFNKFIADLNFNIVKLSK